MLTPLINELFAATLPPNAPTTGPFYVCDITPEYILLCKNPYWYDIKDIVPEYIVEWQCSLMTQVYAALASGKVSLDYWPCFTVTINSDDHFK